ncbi:hypothetical protein OA168_02040 [Candidatus Pelagibacter sp.]|nr:hypothetical protein [Candidatus Pelagibacter sp.]
MKKILALIIIFFFLIELILRLIGFGTPVLYKNTNENYYPEKNQNLKRFKGNNIKINDLEMRTNFSWDNQNRKSIIFYGDSVTFAGSYIDNKDMFSEKICTDYFTQYICGNYGVNGYLLQNLTNRIKQIESRKVFYEKMIIVVSSSFDYGKTDFNNLPLYENFNVKFFKSSTEIINHILFKYNILDRYHRVDENIKISSEFRNNSEQLKEFLELLGNLSKKIDISLFILPTLEVLDGKYTKFHFLNKLKIENIEIINLYNDMINQDFRNLYFNNAHLNKKGHDYLAKIIYEYLK